MQVGLAKSSICNTFSFRSAQVYPLHYVSLPNDFLSPENFLLTEAVQLLIGSK